MDINLSSIDNRIRLRFSELRQNHRCIVEYVWLDIDQEQKQWSLRAKSRTLEQEPKNLEEIPLWQCKSRNEEDDETRLKPVALFRDPMRGGCNKIVLCELNDKDGNKHPSNTRYSCATVMEQFKDDEPQFGMDQEFSLLDRTGRPIGWPREGYPDQTNKYYCGVGTVYGRDVVESHYRACDYAGVNIWSTNAEPLPAMWEFELGICDGISMGDHLWMARFLMYRIADEFDCTPCFLPKPAIPHATHLIPRLRCCTNFSTAGMRREGGLKIIEAAITRLVQTHNEYLEFEQGGVSCVVSKPTTKTKRLTMPPPSRSNPRAFPKSPTSLDPRPPGSVQPLATQTEDNTTAARLLSNREKLFRIPLHVINAGQRKRSSAPRAFQGYMQDRRPDAYCDPYVITEQIVRTVCTVRRRISGPLMYNRGFVGLDGQRHGGEQLTTRRMVGGPPPVAGNRSGTPRRGVPMA